VTEARVDVVVAGLGGMGSAAAYWAAAMGASVAGLEQFQLGHDRGGSHDHSRLTRLAYHHLDYVLLARRAFEVWREVEQAAGEQLVVLTGGVDMFASDAPLGREVYASSLEQAGAAFERVRGVEVRRRWPQLQPPEEVEALVHPQAGLVAADRANAAHQRLAQAAGARLVERCPIRALRADGADIVVEAAAGTWRCRSVIAAAGAWLNELLEPLGEALPLTVTQEQISYLEAGDLEAFDRARFPVWIWHGAPTFYGFPVFGERAVKVAEDHGGPVVTARGRSMRPDEAAERRVVSFARRVIPGLGSPVRSKTCLYTLTPDRDFVISPLPRHPNVIAAVTDGHGFKFASLIGMLLAELALGREPSVDLTRFRADRPALASGAGEPARV
jgi:monomeric sarcosine oxidase